MKAPHAGGATPLSAAVDRLVVLETRERLDAEFLGMCEAAVRNSERFPMDVMASAMGISSTPRTSDSALIDRLLTVRPLIESPTWWACFSAAGKVQPAMVMDGDPLALELAAIRDPAAIALRFALTAFRERVFATAVGGLCAAISGGDMPLMGMRRIDGVRAALPAGELKSRAWTFDRLGEVIRLNGETAGIYSDVALLIPSSPAIAAPPAASASGAAAAPSSVAGTGHFPLKRGPKETKGPEAVAAMLRDYSEPKRLEDQKVEVLASAYNVSLSTAHRSRRKALEHMQWLRNKK